jgi:hypothetical protein
MIKNVKKDNPTKFCRVRQYAFKGVLMRLFKSTGRVQAPMPQICEPNYKESQTIET